MSHLRQVTEFTCAVCNEKLQLDPNDQTTFDSKTNHEKFFGMQLTTYRVSHETAEERHVNTIIVDHMGFFRGHKDAFTESIDRDLQRAERPYWVAEQRPASLTSHQYLDLFFVIDTEDNWVLEIVNSARVRALELARLIDERISEIRRLYDVMPDHLSLTLGDQDLRLWMKETRVVVASLKSPACFSAVEALAQEILRVSHPDTLPEKRLLVLALQSIALQPRIDVNVVRRLVSDDRLFTTVDFPYTSRIQSIVSRLERRFPLANDVLVPLLSGRANVIDLLEEGHINDLSNIFELLDFVDRRGLLE